MPDLDERDISQRLATALAYDTGEAYPEFAALKEYLQGYGNSPPKPAAVLIPLLRDGGQWHILFTRRHANLPEHSGQVAFPGGRADPQDVSLEDTALRETQEEIGLDPAGVRILGRLHDFLTITNYRVTPVVGVIPWPTQLKPAAEEVERIFTIPLDWLADPANREERLRQVPPPHQPVPVIYFRPYVGEILWGASARFTLTLLEILFDRR